MTIYKAYLDDVRETPIGYMRFYSVNSLFNFISSKIKAMGSYSNDKLIFHLDLDHDLGDFYADGGDGINLIKKLIENGYNELKNVEFYFFLHTMNPVGKENMKALIDRYF